MESNEPTPDLPIINIARDKIALGPNRRDLLPIYLQWYNDFEAMMPYLLQLRPRTREAQETMFAASAKLDPSSVDFTIYERSTMRPIGITLLFDIDLVYQIAEYSIFIGARLLGQRLWHGDHHFDA